MAPTRPLTYPDQHRRLDRLVAEWIRAYQGMKGCLTEKREAERAWEAARQHVCEIEGELAHYVDEGRPVVGVIVDGQLYLVKYAPIEEGKRAHITRVICVMETPDDKPEPQAQVE